MKGSSFKLPGLNLLLLCATSLIISGCSTPCGPGRLCAPITSITSAPPGPGAPQPVPTTAATPEPDAVQTFAVDSPYNNNAAASTWPGPSFSQTMAPGQAIRIGLMLPLNSATLGQAAEAVRAGFMAGHERDRDRDRFAITVVDAGASDQDLLTLYATTLASNDLMVGPLERSAVAMLAASTLVSKPTIALNYPDTHGATTALPPQMLTMGLSIEDEARQTALWASREQPDPKALVLSVALAWQQRSASAFSAKWRSMDLPLQTMEMSTLNGYLSDAELIDLRARIEQEQPTLLFVALDVDQTRQLRTALENLQETPIPIYGTSSLNPGNSLAQAGPELDGVRVLDLPWQVQRDDPTVMRYPRRTPVRDGLQNADLERLYALGIDAFQVASEIARHPASRYRLDGVTGQLKFSFGQGPATFERIEQGAHYQDGVLVALPGSQY
ncbi:MAG: outer membrane PBP1 activator LpoA protein [Janthinobacterium sp.]|jgi:outer membrane PBP1 activator LpoA protein